MIQETVLLAGDIGGTKTTLALYRKSDWPGPPMVQHTYRNAAATSLDDLIRKFLRQHPCEPVAACFGVAGPVLGNTVEMTNRDWTIDGAAIARTFGWRKVQLINDLVATVMGAIHLPPADLLHINQGQPQPDAPVAIIAPGTGLGQAFLTWENALPTPHPSEGGHISFAPRGKLQCGLLSHMMDLQGHVSVEQVCSGSAMPNLLAFVQTRTATPSAFQAELEAAVDQTPVIIRAAADALHRKDFQHPALQSVGLFTDILADQAANLALTTMALGGVYLGGGLAPRVLPFIDHQRFISIFTRGIYGEMLSRVPILLIRNPQTACLGAAAYGWERVCGQGYTSTAAERT